MRRIISIVVLAVVAFTLVGCQQKPEGADWGKTKYYRSSLLKKYKPVVMTRTLNFSLNEDAQDLSNTTFKFKVYEKLPSEKMVKAEGIVVYKNGEVCADNILRVKGNEGDVELGLEFTDAVAEGNHLYYLKEVSMCGLDRIEYIKLGNGVIAKKVDIMNPADMGVLIGLIFILGLYIAWLAFFRPLLCPHLKFSNVYITYPGSTDEVRVSCKNSTDIIFTNKPRKQNFLHTIFMVRSAVVVNECFTQDVKIKPASKGRIRVSTLLSVDSSPLDMPERKEKFYVYNDDNQKIGIQTM